MEVKLVVTRGERAGEEVPVTSDKLFIGRSPDCHLRPQSDLVGRHHCAIVVESEVVLVRDFGSKSGTLVNGQRIKGQQELKTGDKLGVGDLEFEVRFGGGLPSVGHRDVPPNGRAAKSGREDELDLDRWLSEPPTAGTPQTEGTGAATPQPAEPPPAEPEAKQEEPVKVVGVWNQGRWKLTTADPRSAAADALKDFFGRRQ